MSSRSFGRLRGGMFILDESGFLPLVLVIRGGGMTNLKF